MTASPGFARPRARFAPLVVAAILPIAALSCGKSETGPNSTATGFVLTSISAGADYTCGLTSAGQAYCWGGNSYGQLGTGDTTERDVPTPVAGGLTFESISSGGDHTCALTAAGAAYCWGGNTYGQLGNGEWGTLHWEPVAVLGPTKAGLSFGSLSAGGQFTCGTVRGEMYCWGANDSGQVGAGGFYIGQICYLQNCASGPFAIAVGLPFQSVTAGYAHACGITFGGASYCWGAGFNGEVGNDSLGIRLAPDTVNGAHTFTQLSAGDHNTCGVTAGASYCWGENTHAELGLGTQTGPQTCAVPSCSTAPIAVTGGVALASLAVGGSHVCGLTSTGAAYCWGLNDAGQLGIGSITAGSTMAPAPVAGSIAFTSLTAAGSHTCGLKKGGVPYCWGANAHGELGNGSHTPSGTPVTVSSPGP